ncbi:MAG: hypothetical protein OXI37_05800 [Gammaproteobacteria bacterium]|nr:hypothetical protein [Gammaproteobacteria bacterium]
MRFTVHDVGHGFCAHLQHDNGNIMLWDCGHKADPENRPSMFLPEAGISVVHRMFITNFDEDHISDLPNLRQAVGINILHRNKSITPIQLKNLKEEGGPISPAMSNLLSMMETYNAEVINPPSFPNVSIKVFYCAYQADFEDTNNLSLVTFLETPMSNFIIPGDLETPAWRKLLQNQYFRNSLEKTNVFIASHHGRASGYCREVFDYCSPRVVIFSDGPQQYATQEEAGTYAAHASGASFGGQTRYVLSTRNDGSLSWNS